MTAEKSKNNSVISFKQNSIEELCRSLIVEIGEDPKREGLQKTPERFHDAFMEMTGGYSQSLQEIVGDALFKSESAGLVVVRNIEIYSLCEHHLLPFFGVAHVGYVPDKSIIGLSKIPRVVEMFSRRLQIQERLTHEIVDALHEVLRPQGIICRVEARHMCVEMRGVGSHSSRLVTTAVKGILASDNNLRADFESQVST